MNVGPKVVLLVDDHAMKLEYTRHRLENAGFSVLTADNGFDALRIVKAEKPNIVVSDIRMSKMDGYGLCCQIRSDPSLAGIPVVLYSAYDVGTEDEHYARSIGAASVMTSSFDVEPLAKKIRSLLSREVSL